MPENPIRCNCESSFCEHGGGLGDVLDAVERGHECSEDATDGRTMSFVGPICLPCAKTAIRTGGGRYVAPAIPAYVSEFGPQR